MKAANWRFPIRVAVKAFVLFALCNLVFALLQPSDLLGNLSLYNSVFPGRERLPHSEDITRSYNLSLSNLPANFASHVVSRPKADDEYRVFLIGDSATWGWYLDPADTYAANINAGDYRTADGRRIVAYNLGYPRTGFLKDLFLLDYALKFQPDAVVWLVTLQPHARQLNHPLIENNPIRARDLLSRYDLQYDPEYEGFIRTDLLRMSIVGQRRELADLLRLQLVGFAWAATGIDQYVPDEYDLRTSDFDEDVSWEDFSEPTTLANDDVALDILTAALDHIEGVPFLIVNEPVYISSGTNSDLRYNAYNPRWAYDQYRELLAAQAETHGWHYADWWDRIAPDEFTNTPLHLTPAGSRELSGWLGEAIVELSSEGG